MASTASTTIDASAALLQRINGSAGPSTLRTRLAVDSVALTESLKVLRADPIAGALPLLHTWLSAKHRLPRGWTLVPFPADLGGHSKFFATGAGRNPRARLVLSAARSVTLRKRTSVDAFGLAVFASLDGSVPTDRVPLYVTETGGVRIGDAEYVLALPVASLEPPPSRHEPWPLPIDADAILCAADGELPHGYAPLAIELG